LLPGSSFSGRSGRRASSSAAGPAGLGMVMGWFLFESATLRRRGGAPL
jgi:hypothetical protein